MLQRVHVLTLQLPGTSHALQLACVQGRSVAWARRGYSPPDFVGVSLHFCVLDLAMRIRTAWEPVNNPNSLSFLWNVNDHFLLFVVLKTCLRTSMGQERLTSLALICMTVERVAKLEARVKDLVN